MFNPFYPFTQKLLQGMVSQGKYFFVRQRLNRGMAILPSGELSGKLYLMTHYSNLVTAQDHYGTIAHDPNRFLYDWLYPGHQEKLLKAAQLHEEYSVYGAVLRTDWESLITDAMEEKVRSYIASLGWEPKRSDAVTFDFELRFGELYATIHFKKRKVRAKFEDIEKITL